MVFTSKAIFVVASLAALTFVNAQDDADLEARKISGAAVGKIGKEVGKEVGKEAGKGVLNAGIQWATQKLGARDDEEFENFVRQLAAASGTPVSSAAVTQATGTTTGTTAQVPVQVPGAAGTPPKHHHHFVKLTAEEQAKLTPDELKKYQEREKKHLAHLQQEKKQLLKQEKKLKAVEKVAREIEEYLEARLYEAELDAQAREYADWVDAQAREFDDAEFEAREFEEYPEAREFYEYPEARDYDDIFEAEAREYYEYPEARDYFDYYAEL